MVNRLKSIMDPGEKRIRQEDCNEDTLGVGILTLTNKRVAFDKKHARVMDFSGSIGAVSYTHLTLPTNSRV